MKTNNIIYIIGILFIAVFAISAVSAKLFEVDYNVSSANQANYLAVQVLKYEPYPVNAGEWFDVWIQVQNIGQSDAPNVTFRLAPEYPFSSNDSLVRNYGLIMGTVNAYKVGLKGDASTVILKYRVKVADNAPEGASNLRVYVTPNSVDANSTSIGTDLPIIIGKTKTDFDVVMQDFTSQGIAFAISNIGENPATAVTFSIIPQGVNITGASSSIIGNLDKGDFTTVTFQVYPNRNLHELGVQIAYTDTAGVRNIIEKNVTVSMSSTEMFNTTTQGNGKANGSGIMMYAYLGVGFIVGALVVLGYNRIKKKK